MPEPPFACWIWRANDQQSCWLHKRWNHAAAAEALVAAGGEIVEPAHPGQREVVVLFRDPGGNLMGIYEQPGLAETEDREASDG